MLFRVENLGPIREAEVDLSKPLIVFAGPNNSGKTYFAWAVYGFERFSLNEELASFAPVVDALVAHPEEEQSLVMVLEQGEYLTELAVQYSTVLTGEFAGVPEHFSNSRVRLSRPVSTLQLRPGGTGRHLRGRRYYVSCRIGEDRSARILVFERSDKRPAMPRISMPRLSGEEQQDLRVQVAAWLSDAIRFALRNWHKTIVFPVERLAISTFAKELVERRSEFVDELRELAIEGRDVELVDEVTSRVDRYPRAIRDALHDATRLDQYRRATSPLSDLADELESTVLGGRVRLSDDNVLEFTPEGSPGTHLRIQQTASVVKSLASLVFFLRHRAKGDERLIIDEPELNLHPDNQRKVARVLAKMVSRGIKLIISTHSDYLIRELNNLIMLSQDSDDARELAAEMGIQAEMTLRPEQLGVYLFGTDGSCEEVPVTETGFEVESIDAAIHALNHDAQTIYYRLFLDE